MIIRNKKTGVEKFVTAEGWTAIQNHKDLKNKYTVVDSAEVKESIKATQKRMAIPEEILDFRKRITENLKKATTETQPEKKAEPKKTKKK